jgi:hypothetical protein
MSDAPVGVVEPPADPPVLDLTPLEAMLHRALHQALRREPLTVRFVTPGGRLHDRAVAEIPPVGAYLQDLDSPREEVWRVAHVCRHAWNPGEPPLAAQVWLERVPKGGAPWLTPVEEPSAP